MFQESSFLQLFEPGENSVIDEKQLAGAQIRRDPGDDVARVL